VRILTTSETGITEEENTMSENHSQNKKITGVWASRGDCFVCCSVLISDNRIYWN
jgi:hypothetical protein